MSPIDMGLEFLLQVLVPMQENVPTLIELVFESHALDPLHDWSLTVIGSDVEPQLLYMLQEPTPTVMDLLLNAQAW